MIKLNYYGHAAFSVEKDGMTLLFDPFLTDNPVCKISKDEVQADYIFVSHGHGDHTGDTEYIAKKHDALVISTAEMADTYTAKGCRTHSMHLGGKVDFPFGYVRVTPAFHGAGIPGGHACGFIVKFYDQVIYFAGDTCLFGDMALLGRLESIDYALLPIGSNFTMGPEDAVIAAEFLKAKNIIPIHYNTWPPIAQDPVKFKEAVEEKKYAKVLIVNPGESIEL